MAQNSGNTMIVKTGSVWGATSGAVVTAPTSAISTLDTDLKEFGYITTDGIEENYDVSTATVNAFQNGDTIDSSVTDATMTFKAVFMEVGNRFVTEAFYGATVDTTDGSVLISPGKTSGRIALVVNYVSGNNLIRYWLPEAEVTKDGGSTAANGEALGFPVLITAYPSSTLTMPDGSSASAKRWATQLIVTP